MARSDPQAAASRWTAATPDARIDAAVTRATTAPGHPEHAQLAAMAVVTTIADRATDGRAQDALGKIAKDPATTADARAEAQLLARSIAADEGTDAGAKADHTLGVVEALSVLGPFRDTGGGLDAHDGPEQKGAAFVPSGRYSWGSVEVAWREVPPTSAQASGVPLDLFVAPRKESCTWLATHLSFASKQTVTVRAAATGQVRLVFDGADVARDEDVHESLRFDRVAARVDGEAGDHLLAAKVCSGALDDDGMVRLRVTDDAGGWPAGVTESASLAGAMHAKKPTVHPATTALARAIAKPAADVDARLDAAILRTLGGADDLRSPRAPGILAALADTGGLDADRLAMAAWIAPSGANRSAWLHTAHEKGDAETRGFVDRRLVERHLDAQLSDWAMVALRSAGLDRAQDAEAAFLEARVDAALGTDALRTRAMHRLQDVVRAHPDAPDVVFEALAGLAESLAPGVAASARQELAKRGDWGADHVRVVAATGTQADVVAAAKRAFEGSLADADDALAVTEAVSRAGAHGDARALYEKLATWAPNRAPVWAGLAEEIGASKGDPTADAAMAVALRRARELEPGEARYRAEIALRAHAGSSRDAEAHDDEKYIVPSQVILARRQGVGPAKLATAKNESVAASDPGAKALPPQASATASSAADAPDVADRQLHSLRAFVMHADRRVSELVHYAREIVIPPRTEEELYENVPVDGELTEILRARVHRKDGSEAFPVEEATENAQPRIRWPELAAGDVVEVAFRTWTDGPVGGRGDPPFYRLDYAGSLTTHPLLYNEDVVDSPADRPIYAAVVNGKADRVETKVEGGRRVQRWVWDTPVNVPDEPLAPSLTETVTMFVISTFKDWGDFRAWYGDAVQGFTDPDAQVRELAAKLTKGKTTREEKLRALFDFVADDIRYVNYVSGEWWLPNRPQQLLARREGDCDDKALLLITLLKAAGIDAQEVMVQTRMTNEPSLIR
ncbi:MAG TPA: transglutaminase family protein, partial [Polyangiaceae bacterium]